MFWLNRVALWSRAITSVAELALDARIFSNDQGLEGSINQEKNLTSTTRVDMAHLSSLITKRWQDNFDSGRLFGRQIKRSGYVIEDRKIRAHKKSGRIPN